MAVVEPTPPTPEEIAFSQVSRDAMERFKKAEYETQKKFLGKLYDSGIFKDSPYSEHVKTFLDSTPIEHPAKNGYTSYKTYPSFVYNESAPPIALADIGMYVNDPQWYQNYNSLGGISQYLQNRLTALGVKEDKMKQVVEAIDYLGTALPSKTIGYAFTPKDYYNISKVDQSIVAQSEKALDAYKSFADTVGIGLPEDIQRVAGVENESQRKLLTQLKDSGLIQDDKLYDRVSALLSSDSKDYKSTFSDIKQYLIDNKKKYVVPEAKVIQLANVVDYISAGVPIIYNESIHGTSYKDLVDNYANYANALNIPKIKDIQQIGELTVNAQFRTLKDMMASGLIKDEGIRKEIADIGDAPLLVNIATVNEKMEPLFEKIKAHLLANKNKYGVDSSSIENIANAMSYIGTGIGVAQGGDVRTLEQQLDDYKKYAESIGLVYSRGKAVSSSGIAPPKMTDDVETARNEQGGAGNRSRYMKQYINFPNVGQGARSTRASSPYYQPPKPITTARRPASSLYTRVKTGK